MGRKGETDLRSVIPQEFYRGSKQPRCFTVKELIEQLSRLPPDLRMGLREDEGVKVIVPNASWDAFCEIESCEFDGDDDE